MASFVRVFSGSMGPGAVQRPSAVILPSFLLPWLGTVQDTKSFSTSTPFYARRDRAKNRGVSAIRRTGLNKRQILSVDPAKLPQPVLDPLQRSEVQVDPQHGLWQFFNAERTPFATPEYNDAHGRAWAVSELRRKHWEDLWSLWWVCVKERNRLATEEYERERMKAGYGDYEAEERDKTVRETMKAIRRVLTERWYAWEDARMLAESDPKINLNPSKGQRGYSPRTQQHDTAKMVVRS